jgi:[ribosomal protein S5]-alanine N-acetyltransferase
MASSPILKAERLSLEPFSEARLHERYVSWLNDPEVTRFSEQRHSRHTLGSCREYFENFSGSPHYFWAVVAHDPAVGHVGNLTATVDTPNNTADLAIMIGERRSWGQGYGAEAWIRACRFLLDEAGMRKVTAGTMAVNHGMLAIMRRAGMVEEGRRRRQFLWQGQEVDAVLVALFPN